MKHLEQKWIDASDMSYDDFPTFKENDLVRFFQGGDGVVTKYIPPFVYLKNSTDKHHILNIKEYIIVPIK